MIKVIKRKISSLRHAIRYGKVTQRLLHFLSLTGIKVALFYWVQESIDCSPKVKLDDTIENYSFEFLTPDELKKVRWLAGEPSLDNKLRKLKDGNKCLAVKHRGEIVGYTWAELGKCSDVMLTINLESNEAYLFDMFIDRSFRGKNIAPRLRVECYEALRSLGYDTGYSISDYFNTPSVRFKTKLNARFLKLFLYIRLFGRFSRTWRLKDYNRKQLPVVNQPDLSHGKR